MECLYGVTKNGTKIEYHEKCKENMALLSQSKYWLHSKIHHLARGVCNAFGLELHRGGFGGF